VKCHNNSTYRGATLPCELFELSAPVLHPADIQVVEVKGYTFNKEMNWDRRLSSSYEEIRVMGVQVIES